MRTFARFFLLLLGFGLLPAGLAMAYFAKSSAMARANARSFHAQIARLAAESAEAAAAALNRSLAFAAEIDEGRLSVQGEKAVLQRAVATTEGVLMAALHAVDDRRVLRLADERLFPLEPDEEAVWGPLAARAASSGRLVLGPVRAKRGRPYLPVAYPLADGRVIRAAYGLEALQRRLAGLRPGPGGRVVLADASGSPLPGFLWELLTPDGRLPQPQDPEGWVEKTPGAQASLVGAWVEAPSLGWTAWSLQPRAEAFAVAEGAWEKALGMFLLLAALVAATAGWIARRLGTPLEQLAQGARRISESRFDASVPEDGWGEFRKVQRAFNAMMRGLEAYQRLQVERQLKDKAKLESIIRTVPSGIVLSQADGKIIYINAAARGILGAAGDTLPTPSGRSMVHVLGEPALRALVEEVASGRRAAHAAELELDRDGKRRFLLCQARAVAWEQRLLGVLLVIDDVTSERELKRLRERFLYAILHDLRGPIGMVSGWIEVMSERGDISENGRKRLGHLKNAVRQMSSLVDNIMDSAKLKARGIKPRLESVPARELLEEARSMFEFQADLHEVSLCLEDSGFNGGGKVLCDRRLITRALGNLVGNAIKFTPRGGRITLRAAPAPGAVEFSVSDTGRGIPPDRLADVFLPFEQVGSDDARLGFGLGLSLVKEWVELRGGTVGVESRPGKGTTFRFNLPAG